MTVPKSLDSYPCWMVANAVEHLKDAPAVQNVATFLG